MTKIVPLIEASSSGYEKKYKCPYCELRLTRQKLPPHIDNKHADMIPEGYTALRVAFNTINHKDHGECIICKREAPWNEEKGRYERLCGRQECIDAYKEMARKRNKNVYGTEIPQSDPRYKEEIQKKALAHRKISGKYKFGDGGYVEYTGSYERKLLEYMDKIMHINSYDIAAPGPSIFYMYEGEEHLYISDFLYIPYNLIVEVKDGGSNKNNNQEMKSSREKTVAKEEAVKKDGKYNYLRLTDNDFSQLMEAFAVLKWKLLDEDTDEKYFKVNEFGLVAGFDNLNESYIFSKDNLYINFDDFKSGKKNICFITGLSGSGKSTIGEKVANENKAEWIELDIFEHCRSFTDDQLKEAGEVFYEYLSSHKKVWDALKNNKLHGNELGEEIKKFLSYCISWCKRHKEKKWIIEGVQIYSFGDPEKIKHEPIIFVNASMVKSIIQRWKRNGNGKIDLLKELKNEFPQMLRWYIENERDLQKFIKAVVNESALPIMEADMTESMNATIAAALAPERTPVESDPNNYMMVQHLQNNKMSYGITKDPQCNEFISVSIKDGMQVHKMDKSKIDKVYTVFKMKDKRKAKEVYDEAVNMLRMGAKVDSTDYFYKRYTGHYILTHDQICFDESFELITPFYDNINALAESVEEFIKTDDRLYFAEQTMKEIERITYGK